MKVWPVIAQTVGAHGTCVLVSVVAVEGSAPREEGSRMIVTPQGFHGTIGGGTLEWRALATAQAMLGKRAAVKMMSQSLGPELGQCCGGRVKLAFEVFDRSNLPSLQSLARREAEGEFEIKGRVTGLDITERFGETRRRLLIFGAGHVGRALVLALAPLPFEITWADPRPEAFPSAVPSNTEVFSGDPLSVVASAPAGSLAFVMSHSHALDLAIVDAALRQPLIARTGVIGSATKRARFEKRLREANVSPERVAALICPIGIEGIRSKQPAAIAVATVAQIVMLDEALAGEALVPVPHQQSWAG